MSRLMALALVLSTSLAFAVVAERGDLVSYSFDDGRVETGPDSFIVFEHANGHVDLSEDYYVTAYESVVIEDVPGNNAFPEIQGYFPQVDDGKLYVQFYLMPTQREEELNIALAGPARFNVEPQGIALWLIFRNGRIEHVSDWIPQVLLPRFEPFQWYRFDVVYDVGRGTYDIAVGVGDDPPSVSLRNQPNAPGSPGSGVGIFSFIGDLRDRSSVRYYIDSLNIGRNDIFARKPGAIATPPPRRSLVDRQIELMRADLDVLPGFIPIRGASERKDVNDPYVAGLTAYLAHDPDRALKLTNQALEKARPGIERALCLNTHGVVLLASHQYDAARRDFAEAHEAAPSLPEPALNLILTAARQGDWATAFGIANGEGARLRDDDRVLALKAKMWMARDRAGAAAQALLPAEDALLVGYRLLLDVVTRGVAAVGTDAIEAYAAAHADDDELKELAGDVFFAAGDYRRALRQYRAIAAGACDRSVLVKASDACERLGDSAGARAFRERAYGKL
ncbi:MAG TPA: tetratricopeptide repeat protein [Candidatus Eisenbacteria bacterium]|nr:tetratricopeptide repeat protein [Candidatus Eisenbacteria bacterium]